MTLSLDNHTIRDALLARGFKEITSENRTTKSWRLEHPLMRHWVSIKLAKDPQKPMATAPLVVHPTDAKRLQAVRPLPDGIILGQPFGGGSTKYDGLPGYAVSLSNLAAIDDLLRILMDAGAMPVKVLSESESPGRQADPLQQLTTRSAEAFQRALLALMHRMSAEQRAMLLGHARAPGQCLSMEAIALLGGYDSYTAANSQYGRLGHLLADYFGIGGLENWTQTLATENVDTDARGHFVWTLRPNLVAALRNLGWVGHEDDSPTSTVEATDDLDNERKERPATTRQALIDARVGQGLYRERVLDLWQQCCAVTGCTIRAALIASHAQAWKDSTDDARLDPYNGLPLTASIDRLFDQGLIAFADDGRLLRKPELTDADLAHLGLKPDARLRPDGLHARHSRYLAAHRARHGF